MTAFRYVSIHDPKWQAEALQYSPEATDLTTFYPRWFIDLLCGVAFNGDSIELNKPLDRWFLRHPDRADEVLVDGCWILFTCDNKFVVHDEHYFSNNMRRFVEGMDEIV